MASNWPVGQKTMITHGGVPVPFRSEGGEKGRRLCRATGKRNQNIKRG